MYKLNPGWTKKKVMDVFKAGNNGTRAVTEKGGCTYLADDGNKCAVGVFIPDGHEAQKCIGTALDVLDLHPDLLQYMPLSAHGMLYMQNAHDTCDHLGPYYTKGDTYKAIQLFLDNQVKEA